jgi:hypothetical protein
MTRTSLAPSWLPRSERRRIDSQLRKLLQSDLCSICSSPLKHNTRTTSGRDAQGDIVVAGECCADQVIEIFGMGFFSHRDYDFLTRTKTSPDTQPTGEQILNAIAAYQKAVADTDKRVDGVDRRGGIGRATHVSVLNHPWKNDDRDWFEQNPERSHRMRPPFPGEFDGVKLPAGREVIVLVRQVEPSKRIKTVFDPDVVLLPGSPDDEAFAHALFEVAAGRETMPSDPQACEALIEKYTGRQT